MSTQTSFPKITILGVEFDKVGISQAVDDLISHTKQPQRAACYVVKPHIEQIEAATKNKSIRDILNRAYLSLPDGVSINWAAYFQQKTKGRLIDVVTSGTKIVFEPLDLHLILPNHAWAANFTWSLLEACAQENVSVFLVGSPRKQISIEDTAKFLKTSMPKLNLVGTFVGRDPEIGFFSDNLKARLIERLRTVKPEIVLVGLGFPRQEYLVSELAGILPSGIFIAEGGTFDYESFGGRVKKAPVIMQSHGLEWLWRLLIEPYRLKRQLAIPRFIWRVYRSSPNKLVK